MKAIEGLRLVAAGLVCGVALDHLAAEAGACSISIEQRYRDPREVWRLRLVAPESAYASWDEEIEISVDRSGRLVVQP